MPGYATDKMLHTILCTAVQQGIGLCWAYCLNCMVYGPDLGHNMLSDHVAKFMRECGWHAARSVAKLEVQRRDIRPTTCNRFCSLAVP